MKLEHISILLVEDNPPDAKLIQISLAEISSINISITHVKRMSEAIEQLATQSFTVILLDLTLPDISGIDTVIEMERHTSGTPIIILTGMDDDDLALKALQVGAQDYLVKQDIDEKVLIKAIRHAVERNVRRVMGITGLGLWDWNITTGEIVFDQSWADLLEYDLLDLENHATFWETLIHPEDKARVIDSLNVHLEGLSPLYQAECRMLTKSGQWKWTLSSGKVVRRNQQGGPLRLVGTIQDITERKQTETAYRFLFKNAMNSIAYHQVIIDEETDRPVDLLYLDVNDLFEVHTGLKKEEVVGHRMTEVFPDLKQSHPNLISTYSRVALTGREVKLEVKFDWLEKWFAISVYSPKRGFCVVVSEDITQRKVSEQALKKLTEELQIKNAEIMQVSQLKDDFLATMSHELRTPLNAILGLSESLQENVYGEINSEQSRILDIVLDSGRHLLGIINDILDLSKINAGSMELHIAAVDVNALCQYCLHLVQNQAKKKNITLRSSIGNEVMVIHTDEDRLKQILVNLLSNAIKFTSDYGQVTLEYKGDPNTEMVRFSVQDTGIGIAEENLEKVFQPFTQIDSRLSRTHEGTGLGLTLVKRATELLGGTIDLESALDQGSCFTISIPWTQIPIQPKALLPVKIEALPENGAQPEAGQSGALILVAEDDAANAVTIQSYLKHKGYRTVRAHNGQEVLDCLETHFPDLILMDIQMPTMDGLETTVRIRNSQDQAIRHIPIIAVTALAMQGDQERCLAAGANDYLSKPIHLQELVRRVEEALKN